jgi:hypothetical protein
MDHDEEVLESVIREDTGGKEWKFYFNSGEPPEEVRREIEASLAEGERTVEDRLREEYFTLLPEIRRVAERLEAEIRYHMLPVSGVLHRYERLAVKCRVKSCESALDKLRRQPGGDDFQKKPTGDLYADQLKRPCRRSRPGVSARPVGGSRWLIARRFPTWTSDPVEDDGEVQALKYYGYCSQASDKVKGEYQVVSMLTGLFWEVEHSAIYKPDARLSGIALTPAHKGRWHARSARETLRRRSRRLRNSSRRWLARTNRGRERTNRMCRGLRPPMHRPSRP